MRLDPWMLRQDWREDRRPFALVDLACWPADQPFDPLPPVPLVGVGDAAHPQASALDVLVEPPVSLDGLAAAIVGAPYAAATLVQLLRAAGALPPIAAVVAESMAMALLQGSAEHRRWHAARVDPPRPAGGLHVDRDGATLRLVIDRPHALNAIDRAMRDALHDAFSLAALDPSIERIDLRAAGRCFGVGADLAEFGTTTDPATAHAIRLRTLPALPLLAAAAPLDVHVRGGCVGASLELAAFAATLTATPDAWFRLPELAMGLLPGAGGTVSVVRRIGRRRAALLMLSGRRIGAATALAWGLVDRIVDDPAADDRRPHPRGGKVVA